MNLIFYYILASWEESVHNDRILEDTLFIKDFKIFDKKYYLIDIKYYNINYFLYSYYNICYHLKKQVAIEKKLVNKKELFNFCYSSLYNIIKRIFGVIK